MKIGSTKKEFLSAYGYCESYDDVSSYDSYREYFNNSAYPRTKTNLWWKDGTTQKVCFFILKDFIYSLYTIQNCLIYKTGGIYEQRKHETDSN